MSHEPVRYADTLIFPAALDPDAVATVRRLNDAGLQAYLVGGCVRDLLLGLIPKDFDVSTEARPRQIRRLFRNSRIIGRRFKLAHVHWPGGKIIEVATFRRTPEGSGEAGVQTDLLITRDNEFGSAEEDALRRDFTVNALLFDVRSNEVIDYVGGVQDLRDRVLRTIGDPATRFAEDPVRMLRAMKFLARLQLQPTPEVAAAMSASAELIGRSSPARVLEEIYKLMACGRARRALPLLLEHGLLQRLLPEVAPYWLAHPEQFAAAGEALDRIDGGRRRVDNHQLLAILCLGPWVERTREAVQDPLLLAHDLFDHAALRMSIPRKDMAAMRHALVTLARLERPRRSRRFRLHDFLRRPVTQQAIQLLYVAALAGLIDPEEHARWAQRTAEAQPDAAPEPGFEGGEPAEDEEGSHEDESGDRGAGGRSRHRRRGGRRRRRGRGGQQGVPFGPQPQRPEEADADEPVAATADADGGPDPSRNGLPDGSDGPREGGGRRRRRRRRGRRGGSRHEGGQPGVAGAGPPAEGVDSAPPAQQAQQAQPAQPRGPGGREGGASEGGRRSRRGRRGGRRQQGQSQGGQGGGQGGGQSGGQGRGQGRGQGGGQGGGRGRERSGSGSGGGSGGRAEPPTTQGPGARNPEDVEDFFDW